MMSEHRRAMERIYAATYRKRHAAQIRLSNARYRLERRAEIKVSNADYYKEHKARIDTRNDLYRREHWDEYLAATRRRYARDPEIGRAARRAWLSIEVNREKNRVAARRYAARHPKERSFNQGQRRIRQRGNGGTHTLVEWKEKRDLLGNVCFYCGEAKPLTRDHKIPLSRGGTNDITNILPACRSCNSRKRMKTTREFLGIAS